MLVAYTVYVPGSRFSKIYEPLLEVVVFATILLAFGTMLLAAADRNTATVLSPSVLSRLTIIPPFDVESALLNITFPEMTPASVTVSSPPCAASLTPVQATETISTNTKSISIINSFFDFMCSSFFSKKC